MFNYKRLLILTLALTSCAVLIIITANRYLHRYQGEVAGVTSAVDSGIQGVILPHHDLARPLLIHAMTQLKADNNPQTIIVLSPNHNHPNSPLAISAFKLKEYSLDQESIKALEAKGLLTTSTPMLDSEHGLSIPMRYLSQTYPQSRFVPIMVSPLNQNQSAINVLASALVKQFPQNALYVISSDFAHNLDVQNALTHNIETIAWIKEFNVPQILGLSDEYLDAPVAMAIWLKIMQLRNALTWEEWQSSHGALILNTPSMQGTSYVTGVFR